MESGAGFIEEVERPFAIARIEIQDHALGRIFTKPVCLGLHPSGRLIAVTDIGKCLQKDWGNC